MENFIFYAMQNSYIFLKNNMCKLLTPLETFALPFGFVMEKKEVASIFSFVFLVSEFHSRLI